MIRSAIDRFSEACGVAGPLRLEIVAAEGSPRTVHDLAQPFAVIGRGGNVDLSLDHPQVSRRHCYLQVLGGHVFVVDLGSQTGIRVGGTAKRWGWVDHTRPLDIGPFRIQLVPDDRWPRLTDNGNGADEPNPLAQNFLQTQSPTAVALEVSGGTEGPRRWRMSRGLALIGRAPECHVRLQEPRISWFHGALVRTPSGVWLVDLDSREGTIVAGERVRVIRLEENCEARIGVFVLRLAAQDLGTALQMRGDPAAPAQRPAAPVWEPAANGRLPDLVFSTPTELSNGQKATAMHGPDPLQQTVMALAQMLVSMHRDQMELVRDELAEVRKLAAEMRALKADEPSRPVDAPKPATPKAAPQPAPVPAERPDPEVAMAIANDFLEAYHRDRHGAWSTFVRLFTSLTRVPGLRTATRPR